VGNLPGSNKQLQPRELMAMAVAAMETSRPEPKSDGTAPLYVGAAVLFSDGRFDSASRGEFRLGDHAEYTLLERKHPADAFDGAVVFSTLEPCAGEHARSEGKTPCAQRLIEARVKAVWMGIQDPDPTIAGVGKAALEAAGIKVELFDPDYQDRINELNQDWIDQADRRAAVARIPDALADVTPPSRKIVLAAAGATRADLDRGALERYRVEANLDAPSIRHPDFTVALAQMGWMTLLEDRRTFVPTKMGILLFGKRPRDFYPNFLVKAAYDFGPGLGPATKDFDGPLVLFPAELELWLAQTLPSVPMRHNVIREDFAVVTKPWIREAVMNAVAHRDYEMEGGKISLDISQEAISVSSPGRPAEQITLEKLNGFRASSLSVNPKIHHALNKMRAAEERGYGMKMLEQVARTGLPRPSYTYDDPYLTLTIPLTADAALAAELLVLNPETTANLSLAERRGLAFLLGHPHATNRQYADAIGVSLATGPRHLRKFETDRLIVRTGTSTDRVIEVTARAKR
jgi:ATP-dependent DNA helicase RecG